MADRDSEDKALQNAIRESLRDRPSAPPLKLENEMESGGEVGGQLPPKRANIDDRIKDIALRAALELPWISEPGADTWVFIDPPPIQPEQDMVDFARYVKCYERPICMKKETLTSFSPVFTKYFEPTAQFRVKRRRNVVRALQSESYIKYVIDLTPPSEGEEAVYLMTELSCTEGVRLWFQASDIWRVAQTLVGGEEEFTSGKLQLSSSTSGLMAEKNGTNEETIVQRHVSPTPASPTWPSPCMTLEYSPIRHRSAIERLLDALLGSDPKLDSAPKVWTTFAVARYFEIKHSKLNDYIISWLRAYPNSYFLEVLPEVSLQIAEGLENYELARDVFAILVGEEALDNVRRARTLEMNHKSSTYGRKKENLPEHIHTRVEYASKSFIERNSKDFLDFAEVAWIENLPEFQRLQTYTQPEIQEDIQKLKLLLKEYVRGTIYKLLCVNYNSVPAQDLHHPGGKDLFPRVSRSEVWIDKLSINERILTRTFWQALKSFRLFRGATNTETKEGWGQTWDTPKLSNYEELEMSRGTYRSVKTMELKKLIRACWQWIEDNAPSIPFSLPIRTLRAAVFPKKLTNQSEDLMQFSDDDDNNPDPIPEEFQTSQQNSRFPARPIDIRLMSSAAWQGYGQEAAPPAEHHTVTRNPIDRRAFEVPGKPAVESTPRQHHASNVARDRYQFPESLLHLQNRPEFPAPGGFSSWNGSHTSNVNHKQDVTTASWARSQSIARPESPTLPIIVTRERDADIVEESIAHNVSSEERYKELNACKVSSDLRAEYRDLSHVFPSSEKQEDQTSQTPMHRPLGYNFFNLEEFFLQAEDFIDNFAKTKLNPADYEERPDPFEIGLTNTLVCLQDSEWKYLPLWAGGNDDGSGGVFNDQVPIADLGFSTAGPDIHDGTTPAGSEASSDFDVLSIHSGATSSYNTSLAVNRGFSDHMRRGHVYTADSADTASSHHDDDSFTIMTDDSEEEEYARQQMEARERLEAAEQAVAQQTWQFSNRSGRMEDENYADLFNSEDDDGDETDRAEMGDDDDDDEMDESDDEFEVI